MNIFKVVGDFMADLPTIEKAIPVAEKIFAEIKAGKLPTLSPEDMALVEKLVADVKQLAADVRG